MIKYIKRENIDVIKYDNCITNSLQSRVYAYSWYLDIVADNWDVLVLDDYQAVIPIPWKKKYFVRYITQPSFCQQLGVFSINGISKNLFIEMLNNIPKKYVKVSLNFNADNISIPNVEPKKNYVLKLNNTFQNLFKSFSKGRKHAVRVGEKKDLELKGISILELIAIKEKFYPHINFNKSILKRLVDVALSHNKGFILGVFKDDALLGGGFFLKSNHRIIYLFSSFNEQGRKLQAASFLIGNVIKQYENSNYLLDFEGGSIPNIGSFFKSFGASNVNYHHMNYNNLLTFMK